jgi:hypothetical protein
MPTSYSTTGAHSGGERGHQKVQAMLPDRAEVIAHPCLLVGIVLGALLEDHTTRLLLGTDSVPVILR